MTRLSCADYGFNCNFVAEEDNMAELIEKFAKHTLDEHGIEYSKEGITQFILRQK
jgi:predicted small metal-binding protein